MSIFKCKKDFMIILYFNKTNMLHIDQIKSNIKMFL